MKKYENENINREAVTSLVKVNFSKSNISLYYLNEGLDVKVGDDVFVSGKYEGVRGTVVEVNTKFKVKASGYEKIESVMDYNIHGSFYPFGNLMVSTGINTLYKEQLRNWFLPPEKEDEYITGEGFEIDINDMDVPSQIIERGIKYMSDGKIHAIYMEDSAGYAVVEGTEYYMIEFTYDDGILKDVFCSCPYGGCCKHEIAVAIILDIMKKEGHFNESRMCAIDKSRFFEVIDKSSQEVKI